MRTKRQTGCLLRVRTQNAKQLERDCECRIFTGLFRVVDALCPGNTRCLSPSMGFGKGNFPQNPIGRVLHEFSCVRFFLPATRLKRSLIAFLIEFVSDSFQSKAGNVYPIYL